MRDPRAILGAGPLGWATEMLRSAGVGESRREARLIWSELAGTTPGAALVLSDAGRDADLVARFRQAVERRAAGEPRQHVVGTVGFRRLILGCDSRALIPRPETEGLIDLALAHCSTGRALDLGAGSGCLSLALADEGAYSEVVGIERSAAALALARENAARTGLTVRWMQGDWVEPVVGEWFDVIVTNPPYIAAGELGGLDPSVRDWEPATALDGGPDGLTEARRILAGAPGVLSAGGWLFMELDAGRAALTAEVAVRSGWRAVRVLDDLYRRPRYLAAQWEPDNV